MADPTRYQLSDFARQLAEATGITPTTVAAWQRSENGPADNPLNLGPGGHYSDPVSATTAFLTTGDKAGYYKGILAARGNPAAEIAAIKASPFDASHYANGVLDRVAAEYGVGGGGSVLAQPVVQSQPSSAAVAQPAQQQSGVSSTLAPLLGLMSQNQQAVGLPGLPPALLLLAAQQKSSPTATAPTRQTASAAAPKIQVQGKVTQRVQGAVNLVQEYLGTPYVWGGEKPGGFDCSGLLQYVWGKQGVQIPRVTYDQWKTGQPVAKSNLQPGDAVFFHPGPKGPEHVGMYLGGGKFIEAPRTGLNVRISNLEGRTDFLGGRRYA